MHLEPQEVTLLGCECRKHLRATRVSFPRLESEHAFAQSSQGWLQGS